MNRRSGKFYQSGDPKLEPCPGSIHETKLESVLNTSRDVNHAAERIEAMLLGAKEPEDVAVVEQESSPPPIDFDAVALMVEKRVIDRLLSNIADLQKNCRVEIANLRKELTDAVAKLNGHTFEVTNDHDKRLQKLEERVGRGPGRPPKKKTFVEPKAKTTEAKKSGEEIEAEILSLPDPEADPYANDPS